MHACVCIYTYTIYVHTRTNAPPQHSVAYNRKPQRTARLPLNRDENIALRNCAALLRRTAGQHFQHLSLSRSRGLPSLVTRPQGKSVSTRDRAHRQSSNLLSCLPGTAHRHSTNREGRGVEANACVKPLGSPVAQVDLLVEDGGQRQPSIFQALLGAALHSRQRRRGARGQIRLLLAARRLRRGPAAPRGPQRRRQELRLWRRLRHLPHRDRRAGRERQRALGGPTGKRGPVDPPPRAAVHAAFARGRAAPVRRRALWPSGQCVPRSTPSFGEKSKPPSSRRSLRVPPKKLIPSGLCVCTAAAEP